MRFAFPDLLHYSSNTREHLGQTMTSIVPLDHRLFELGLDHVEPNDFERFGQAFYAALEGKSFVPLGGQGDGGADGISDPSLFAESGAKRVLQISKSADHRPKIRGTVQRLREFGREFRSLTYLTSIEIKNSDSEEDHLSEQLGVPVRIEPAVTRPKNAKAADFSGFR